MPDDSKPGSTIKSLVKTLRLLKLFSPQHNVWTAEDMVSITRSGSAIPCIAPESPKPS